MQIQVECDGGETPQELYDKVLACIQDLEADAYSIVDMIHLIAHLKLLLEEIYEVV